MSTSVAIYARVSSDRQARQQTIASQVAALRERVVQDGFTLSDALTFVDEGRSGAISDRPAACLRDSAAAGLFDRLYVLCPDRLSRDPGHLYILIDEWRLLRRRDRLSQSSDRRDGGGRVARGLQGIIAEYERTKIQERSRRGKRYAAQRGSVNVFTPRHTAIATYRSRRRVRRISSLIRRKPKWCGRCLRGWHSSVVRSARCADA